MPKLPDVTIGQVDTRSKRPRADIDTNAPAAGAERFARSMEQGADAVARSTGIVGDALARVAEQEAQMGRAVEQAGAQQGRATAAAGAQMAGVIEKAGAERAQALETVGRRGGAMLERGGTAIGEAVTRGGRTIAAEIENEGALYAKGQAAFGKGIGELAKDVGKTVKEMQDARERLEFLDAQSTYRIGVIKSRADFEHDQDYGTLGERYKARVDEVRQSATGKISDPDMRKRFELANGPEVEKEAVWAADRAYSIEGDAKRAGAQQKLIDAKDALLRTGDEQQQAKLLDDVNTTINEMYTAGYWNAEQAGKARRLFMSEYGAAWVKGQPLDEQARLLRDAPGNLSETAERIIGAEYGSGRVYKNPRSTASGPGQFIDETWLRLVRKEKPELADRGDAELLALRRDRGLSKEMVVALAKENAEALGRAGYDATPGNIYLSHFLGVGDAIKVLRANPGTPVEALLSPKVVADNREVLSGQTAGAVAAWASGKMGAGYKTGTPADFVSTVDRRALLQDTEKEIVRRDTNLAALRTEEYERSIVDVGAGKGTLIPREMIENDPNLTPSSRNALLRLYDTANKRTQTEAVGNRAEEYERMILDATSGNGVLPPRAAIESDSSLDTSKRNTLLRMHESAARDISNRGDKERNVAAAQRSEDYERAIIDGSAGIGNLPLRRSIEADPALTDAKRNTLLRQLDSATSDARLYQSALQRFQTGGKFNPYDADERKAVDTLFVNQGGTPEALQQIVDRTGVMPKTAAVSLRGSLVSNDPAKVQTALQTLTNLVNRNQNIFVGVTGEKELEEAATGFRHDIENYGFTAEQAAKRYIESQTPEYQSTVKARLKNENVDEVVKKQLSVSDIKSAFNEGVPLVGRPAIEFTLEGRQAAMNDYAELFRDKYMQTGDVGKAKALATEQLKKVWGVSYLNGNMGGTLMRYPPERAPAYAGIPDAGERIAGEATAAIKAETGKDVDRSRIIMTPVPLATSRAYMSGEAPPYLLSWMDKEGRLQTLNPGKAFVADANAMRGAMTGDRQRRFDRATAAGAAERESGDDTRRPFGVP